MISPQLGSYYPAPVSDGQGGWMTCWYSFNSANGGSGTVYTSTSTDSGASWTPPVNTSTESGCYFPSLATDNEGRYMVAFEMPSSYASVAVKSSTNFGATWSAPTIVSGPRDSHATYPQISTDGRGTWMVAGIKNAYSSDSVTYWVARSTDNGATWVTTPRGTGSNPGIATDRRGRWLLTWYGGSYPVYSVQVATSTDNGNSWSQPANIGTCQIVDGGGGGGRTTACYGRNGTWMVTWATGSAGAGTGADQDIVYSRTTNDGKTWSAAAPLNTDAQSDDGHDYTPTLTGDGRGNWMATWWSRSSLNNTIGLDPDILYACSSDNGISWSAPQPVEAGAASDSLADNYPFVATDGLGTWVCQWIKYENPYNYRPFSATTQYQAPKVTLVSPRDEKCVAGNRVLVKAEIAPYPYSPRAAVVRFEYRPASQPEWQPIPAAVPEHPNPDPTAPYFTHWDVTVLPAGDYVLRAVAKFGDSAEIASPPITVSVSSNCGNGQATDSEGITEAYALTQGTTETRVAAADSASSRSLDAIFGAGSLPDGTVVRFKFRPQVGARTSVPREAAFNTPVQVSLGSVSQTAEPFQLSLDYPDVDQDGIVDGTSVAETDLAVFANVGGVWTRTPGSQVDSWRNRVSAPVSAAGEYALMSPAAGVDEWSLY